MKKRSAFFGAILSLIPLGQPLLIKTGLFLSSFAVTLSLPAKVIAESAKSLNKKGMQEYEKGDHYAAISYYSKAIKKEPNEPAYWNNRGLSKNLIGDLNGAINDFQRAVIVDKNYDEAFGNLCAVNIDLEDYYGAISSCNKAIKISLKERHFSNRANAKRLLEDYEGALRDVNKAIEIDSKNYRPMLVRSMIKESMGDIKGACLDAKKSKSLGNNDEKDNNWIIENCKRKY